VIVLVDLA